jgi:hypothetical protein
MTKPATKKTPAIYETLYQVGSESNCNQGHPQYAAFVEDEGTPNAVASDLGYFVNNKNAVILGCYRYTICSNATAVEPGDSMTAAVVDHGTYTRWTIRDTPHGRRSWTHTKTWITHAHRHTAECVEEAPPALKGRAVPTYPADFGSVTFSNCQASDTSGELWGAAATALPLGWHTSTFTLAQNHYVTAIPEGRLSVAWIAPGSPLPDVSSTEDSAQKVEGLLQSAGLLSSLTPKSSCASIQVLGAKFQKREADLIVGHESAAGCNPNLPFGTLYQIRNGKVAASSTVCDGPCQTAFVADVSGLYPHQGDQNTFSVNTSGTVVAGPVDLPTPPTTTTTAPSGPPTGSAFMAALAQWNQSFDYSSPTFCACTQGNYWQQAASDLQSGISTDGGNTSGYSAAASELQDLASLPLMDDTPAQMADATNDISELNAFFGTSLGT